MPGCEEGTVYAVALYVSTGDLTCSPSLEARVWCKLAAAYKLVSHCFDIHPLLHVGRHLA